MKRIFNIAMKDILQTLRSPTAAIFLIVLPIILTTFFGMIFSNTDSDEASLEKYDLTVFYEGADSLLINSTLAALSDVPNFITRLHEVDKGADPLTYSETGDADAVLFIPSQFAEDTNTKNQAVLYVDQSTSSGQALLYQVQQVISEQIVKQQSVVRALSAVEGRVPYSEEEYAIAFEQMMQKADLAWQQKAVEVKVEKALLRTTDLSELESDYDQSSPGMLVQFTIMGLMGSASILVQERKTKTIQRMLTTATSETEILLGHILSMFLIIFIQQVILALAGKFMFNVDYLREPLAILLVMVSLSLWVTSMGIFIGLLSKNEDQVVLYALVAMFTFTALGGAWFPLEGTSAGFYNIARYTPGAWAMTGFQNIVVRKLDIHSVLIPSAAMLVYALLFFSAAVFLSKKRKQ